MNKLGGVFGILLMLAGCNQGVPPVDDPNNIVINGEAIPPAKFLERYCVEQVADPTCSKVRHAMLTNTRGEVPRF